MASGAVSLRKSHDIIILSFCNIIKGQANHYSLMDGTMVGCFSTIVHANLEIFRY